MIDCPVCQGEGEVVCCAPRYRGMCYTVECLDHRHQYNVIVEVAITPRCYCANAEDCTCGRRVEVTA